MNAICMELQLGLALALPRNITQGFDLNSHANEAAASVNRDHHDDSSLTSTCTSDFNDDTKCKKRGFGRAFENHNEDDYDRHGMDCQSLLPFLPLTPHRPNEDDKHPHDYEDHRDYSSNIIQNEEALAGWPPISSRRKKLCNNNRSSNLQRDVVVEVNRSYFVGRRASNSMFVKVKMEGVGIARKVDLSLYHSVEKLKGTLMNMFGKSATGQENPDCYKLTYQDTEGDWLLAEDVPWRGFIQSVQRLELVKNMDGMI